MTYTTITAGSGATHVRTHSYGAGVATVAAVADALVPIRREVLVATLAVSAAWQLLGGARIPRDPAGGAPIQCWTAAVVVGSVRQAQTPVEADGGSARRNGLTAEIPSEAWSTLADKAGARLHTGATVVARTQLTVVSLRGFAPAIPEGMHFYRFY